MGSESSSTSGRTCKEGMERMGFTQRGRYPAQGGTVEVTDEMIEAAAKAINAVLEQPDEAGLSDSEIDYFAARAALEAALSVVSGGESRPDGLEEAENEWSAYAVTLNQRIDALIALAKRRGIDQASIDKALAEFRAGGDNDGGSS